MKPYPISVAPTEKTNDFRNVESYDWPGLCARFSRHEVGWKHGSCFCPSQYAGGIRSQDNAQSSALAVLDSDNGTPLAEIAEKIQARQFAAIVSSSHSHRTTETKVARPAWERFCDKLDDKFDAAGKYLLNVKRFRPEVASPAFVYDEDDQWITLSHAECAKARVIFPLARLWRAADCPDHTTAVLAFHAGLAALAHHLGIAVDESCIDVARLYFDPRCPLGGPAPEFKIIHGGAVDIFRLPLAPDYHETAAQKTAVEVEPDTPANLQAAWHYLLHEAPVAIHGAHANDETLLRTYEVRDRGVSFQNALNMMRVFNSQKVNPPWPDAKLVEIVTNAFKYPKNDFGVKSVQAGFNGVGVAPAEYKTESEPKARAGGMYTAAQLQGRIIAELRWLVLNFICEGLTILAGKPKIGKSWLALLIALAVAMGIAVLGQQVTGSGPVLYCGLEDGERRMQRRIKKLIGATGWPENLHILHEMPAIDAGGMEVLITWLDEHPDAKLIVIDTLGKVRGQKQKNEEPYQYDYRIVGSLQKLATDRGIAIVLIHHVRKAAADDVLVDKI